MDFEMLILSIYRIVSLDMTTETSSLAEFVHNQTNIYLASPIAMARMKGKLYILSGTHGNSMLSVCKGV